LTGKSSPTFGARAPADPSTESEWYGYLRRVANGERDALGALYDQSSALVFGLALRILGNPADAEEITLDVFTQVWRAAATFDPPAAASRAGWWYLTRSRAIDRLRSRSERDAKEHQGVHPEPQSHFALPKKRAS
jgi:RNA polymerase sigma-70 factor (ECF subfamily)